MSTSQGVTGWSSPLLSSARRTPASSCRAQCRMLTPLLVYNGSISSITVIRNRYEYSTVVTTLIDGSMSCIRTDLIFRFIILWPWVNTTHTDRQTDRQTLCTDIVTGSLFVISCYVTCSPSAIIGTGLMLPGNNHQWLLKHDTVLTVVSVRASISFYDNISYVTLLWLLAYQ